MALSLYDISIPSYLQGLGAVAGFLEKGRAHCADQGGDTEALVGTSIHPDMLPLRFQVGSVRQHSLGTIEGIRSGRFAPWPMSAMPDSYAGLQEMIAEAATALEAVDRAELDARTGANMVFEVQGRELPFTTENFVLSFSLPNFYFHAATAYDILRMKDVPLGKRDFMGRMRMG